MSIELIILFFIVAFVYSSVGFGGGSSYLAILTLFGIDFLTLRAVALLCNITVVSGSVIIFWRQGLIKWNKTWPIVIASVPAAFLGGYLEISERMFFILLAATLLIASVIMFYQRPESDSQSPQAGNLVTNTSIGGTIGFLAGLVGIGGGIFLSPLLHIIKWDRAIAIASTASVFILLNSISGLLGQAHNLTFSTINLPFVLSLVAAVFLGGQLGVRVGIFKFDAMKLKRVTAVLVFIVAIRILYKYLTH